MASANKGKCEIVAKDGPGVKSDRGEFGTCGRGTGLAGLVKLRRRRVILVRTGSRIYRHLAHAVAGMNDPSLRKRPDPTRQGELLPHVRAGGRGAGGYSE